MLKKGLIVGSYKLEQRLGKRGQDGEVWKGIKIPIGVPYALKFLHNLTEDGKTRFQNEIRRLVEVQGKLTHLMEIHDAGEIGQNSKKMPYYVMKIVPNPQPLDEFLTDNPTLVISMLRQAAIGLMELHQELGLNHTDIKGKNLLVGRGKEPLVYVSDFGFISKRGAPIENRDWALSSKKPPDWTNPNDVDVWQLGATLQSIISRTSHPDNTITRWLSHLADELAPNDEKRIPSAMELCERLDRYFQLSPTGVLTWPAVPKPIVASLVTKAYEYRERPLSTDLLIDLLLRERRPRISAERKDAVLEAIEASLGSGDRELFAAWRSSPKHLEIDELPSNIAEEVIKLILFGLPFGPHYLEAAQNEWRYLKALINDIPSRQPLPQHEAVYEKYARAVVRHKKRAQVTLWDAGTRFLVAGKGTNIYLCSGHDEFAISGHAQGQTDLRSTAVDSLQRGARFTFVIPDYTTDSGTSVVKFLNHVRKFSPALIDQIQVVEVAKICTADPFPELIQAGQYFTPGFRFILFDERDPARAAHDQGAFFIGLPRKAEELFAFQYDVDDAMARDFIRWLHFITAYNGV